jgi:hypothetical protein
MKINFYNGIKNSFAIGWKSVFSLNIFSFKRNGKIIHGFAAGRQKFLVVFLAFWQIFFLSFSPVAIYAQELNEEQSLPSDLVSLATGDATSSAITQNDSNIAEVEIYADSILAGCEQENCNGPINAEVSNTQVSDTTADSLANSETGENNATVSGGLSLDTGDADSLAVSDSQTNLAAVSINKGSGENMPSVAQDDSSDSPNDESSSSSLPPEASLTDDTKQQSLLTSSSSASSETGNNKAFSNQKIEMVTGIASAVATNLNMANINLVGSDLFWLIENIMDFQEKTINLYSLFSNLPEPQFTGPLDMEVATNQESDIKTKTQAESNTGENQASGGLVDLATGNAVSVANTVNLTNLNLVGGRGLFTVVNIVGGLLGDIILPNQNHLSTSGLSWKSIRVETNQDAVVDSTVSSESNTGENSLGGGGSLLTGDALAISNNHSFVNLVRVNDGWAFVVFNVFGDWSGSLLNWDAPGSRMSLGYGTTVLEQDWDTTSSGVSDTAGDLIVKTNQRANVQSETSALANTGKNSIQGEGNLLTGDALSIANNFTLANFVGVGGPFMWGIFNVLGIWDGNLVIAYPDLEVSITDGVESLTPGSSSEYTISVANRGSAKASGVFLDLSFSEDYIPEGGSLSWGIGDLNPGESRTFKFKGVISPTALANTPVEARAEVFTSDVEESTSNNSALDSTLIVLPPVLDFGDKNTGSKDTRLPNLEISVWNNVNDFVYPGDTVLASITVANQSSFTARDVLVEGNFSNDHPMPPIPMRWELGDLMPGQRVKIEFRIGLTDALPEGVYHITAWAKARSESGDESISQVSQSDFLVKLKKYARKIVPQEEVLADEGEVLGASAESLPDSAPAVDKKKYLPYIFAINTFFYFVISSLRKKAEEKELLPVSRRKKRNG